MRFLPLGSSKERAPFDARTFRKGPHITAERTGGLIAAGASGTAWRTLHYAEVANTVWDAGLDMGWCRLALIGNMLSGGHHTLHEILTASDNWAREEGHRETREHLGFEYHDNWGRYRHLPPLTERELREHVALGGLFPDELVRGPDIAAYDPVDDARQALVEHLSVLRGDPVRSGPDVAGPSHLPPGAREFTVTLVDGGTGYDVVHKPSGLRTRFAGEAREVVYHEANPVFGPSELRKLKVAVHYVRQDDGQIAKMYELLEPGTGSPSVDRFTVQPAPQDLRRSRQAEFSVREKESGLWLHYLADGRPVAKDQPLVEGGGYLRFDMLQPGREPQLLGADGAPSELPPRAERLEGDEPAVVPPPSAEAVLRAAWDVGPEVNLDHEYGPLIAPAHVKEHEKGPDGQSGLNPVRYRLGDFEPAFLERTGGHWIYTVDAVGEILIGAEQIRTVVTEEEWQRLVEGMRHVAPELTLDAVQDALDAQGHPTIAAEFDESGQMVAGSMARVSGELWWNQDAARWEVNDRSGRYMKPRTDFDIADSRRWVGNVAARMSARFGIEITPGLLMHEPLVHPTAEGHAHPRAILVSGVWQAAIDKAAGEGLIWQDVFNALLDAYGRGLIDLVPENRPIRNTTIIKHYINPAQAVWELAKARRYHRGVRLVSKDALCEWLATDYLRGALSVGPTVTSRHPTNAAETAGGEPNDPK